MMMMTTTKDNEVRTTCNSNDSSSSSSSSDNDTIDDYPSPKSSLVVLASASESSAGAIETSSNNNNNNRNSHKHDKATMTRRNNKTATATNSTNSTTTVLKSSSSSLPSLSLLLSTAKKPGIIVTILILVIGTSILVSLSNIGGVYNKHNNIIIILSNDDDNNSIRKIHGIVSEGENQTKQQQQQQQQEGILVTDDNHISRGGTINTTTTTTTIEKNQSTTRIDTHHQNQLKQQQQQRTKPRYFGSRPVTNEEHKTLLRFESSHKRYKNNNNNRNQTFAVCHPTLFGDVKFHRVLSFVSYYRLLGFQHIFLWIDRSSSVGVSWTSSQYQQLQRLKYVTLTDYIDNNSNNNDTIVDTKYHGQSTVQDMCRSDLNFAANYDWNLVVDVDEYLWLGHQHHTIQEFMDDYNQHNQYTYISFGKWQYSHVNILKEDYDAQSPPPSSFKANNNTDSLRRNCDIVNGGSVNIKMDNRNNALLGHFGIDRYAFTPKLYCFKGKNNGSNQHKNFQWQNSNNRQPNPTTTTTTTTTDDDYCPDWPGRCKILSKSSKHTTVAVHGYDEGLKSPDGIHWNHQTAHIKEWPGIGVIGADVDVDDKHPLLFQNDSMTAAATTTTTATNTTSTTRVFVRSSRKPFATQNNSEVGVHSLQEAFRRLANGSVPVFYDKRLKSWIDFVASRIQLQQER